MKRLTRAERKLCPACPDGNVWNADGPTGQCCPICLGHAVVNLDGSPVEEAVAERALKRGKRPKR